jgi:hypothetical protein
MQITVSIKSVYGNELIYPECETGKLLAELTGKKTLTRDALATIKKLGYGVEVQAPELDA